LFWNEECWEYIEDFVQPLLHWCQLSISSFWIRHEVPVHRHPQRKRFVLFRSFALSRSRALFKANERIDSFGEFRTEKLFTMKVFRF
jgi:hypothetical protein